MRPVATLPAILALVMGAACTSAADYATPSAIGGIGASAAKGGGRGGDTAIAGQAVATAAIQGAFSGTFDSGGNFSGSGTFTFNLTQWIENVTSHGDPADCGGGSTGVSPASFATLSGTGGSLLSMTSGQTMIKSVRFSALTSAGSSPSSCQLHFRGNAILDELTEMSRMAVVCTGDDGATCTNWTLETCPSALAACGPNDTPAEGSVGQLYGEFPKRTGLQPMARYRMPWSMTITKSS